MPSLSSFFPAILTLHIALAVSLFLPSLLLPFALRGRDADHEDRGGPVRLLLWLQGHGSLVVGGGLALTGLAMLAVLGLGALGQGWLLLALAVYAATMCTAYFVQRPGLRRLLVRNDPRDDAALERWRARARTQRYVSYVMASAVGLIAFLMSTKPSL